MIYFVLLLLGVGVVVPGVRAATLSLSLHFTEEELSPAWTSPNLFGLSFHRCTHSLTHSLTYSLYY
jgi:hypothetical protein